MTERGGAERPRAAVGTGSTARRSGLRRFAADSSPAPELERGTVIGGRYRLVRRIGEGGMGAVYAAEQIAIGRHVALKVVRPELARDPAVVERFRREARAATRIRSPHVVVIHDFGGGDDGAPLYLVMELLDGESLEDRLARDGAIAPREAVAIARQIAAALAAAHEAGVVHRDLKPANVLLAHGEPLKVIDFGIAGISEPDAPKARDSRLTGPGVLLGSPAYMSPEACARRPVGPPADLYALGVTLYEMLVGALPFEEEEMLLLLASHLRVPPQLVRQARPTLVVPDGLETLVDSLLAKDPEERPANARVVMEALDGLEWDAAAPKPTSEGIRTSAAPAITAARRDGFLDDFETAETEVAPLPIVAASHVALAPALASGPHHTVFAAPGDVVDAPAPLPVRVTRLLVLLAVVVGALLGGVSLATLVVHLGTSSPAPAQGAEAAQPAEAAQHVVPAATTRVAPPAAAPVLVPPAASPPSPPGAPAVVRVTITVRPRHAALTWDDGRVAAGTLELPRDGRVHRLVVAAPGHLTQHRDVTADRDQRIAVELQRAAARRDRTQALAAPGSAVGDDDWVPPPRPLPTPRPDPSPSPPAPPAATRPPSRAGTLPSW